MKTRQIKIESRADGAKAAAELMICENCGGEVFCIYVIAGHTHPHLQCFECTTTFCAGGPECDLMPPPVDTSARVCRVCGCTDTTPCIRRGSACCWVSEDLCSACAAPALG
jgi:hypothetical protein